VPEEVPKAPAIRGVATRRPRFRVKFSQEDFDHQGDGTAWLIDSGANVILVPRASDLIVRTSRVKVTLDTAGGKTSATRCWVKTPVGVRRGLAADVDMYILPMWMISENGSFMWRGKKPRAFFNGREFNLTLKNNTPVLIEGKPNVHGAPEQALDRRCDSTGCLVSVDAGASAGGCRSSIESAAAANAKTTPMQKKGLVWETMGKVFVVSGSLSRQPAGSVDHSTEDDVVLRDASDSQTKGGGALRGTPSGDDGGLRATSKPTDASKNPLDDPAWVEQQKAQVMAAGEWNAAVGIPPEHFLDHLPAHPDCPFCKRGKITYAPARNRVEQVPGESKIGQRYFADLVGPWPKAIRGENTLLLILESKHRLSFLFPLRSKAPSGVKHSLSVVRRICEAIGKELGEELGVGEVWILTTDQGGEFAGVEEYIADAGGAWVPVPKGRHVAPAERLARTATEGIRTFLAAAGLPATFWAFAAIAWCIAQLRKHEGWRKAAEKNGWPIEPKVFGELVLTKLPEGCDEGAPRGTEVARPCAFLGHSLLSKRAATLMYLASNGSYHTTTTDRGGVATVGRNEFGLPRMAFHKVYSDLKLISIPCDEFGEDAPNLAVEPGIVDGRLLQPAKRPTTGPGWVRPYSTCPACRGTKRGHTFEGRGTACCRWSGLDRSKLAWLRAEGKPLEEETVEELIELAARKSRSGMLWARVKQQFSESVREIEDEDDDEHRVFKAIIGSDLQGESDAETRAPTESASSDDEASHIDSSKVCAAAIDGGPIFRRWEDAQVLVAKRLVESFGKSRTDGYEEARVAWKKLHKNRRAQARRTVRAIRRVQKTEADAQRHVEGEVVRVAQQVGVEQLMSELNASMLDEADRAEALKVKANKEGAAAETIAAAAQAEHDTRARVRIEQEVINATNECSPCAADAHVYLTKSCTKDQRNSAAGVQCRVDEAKKVEDKGTFGRVATKSQILRTAPDATVSRLHMLCSIKHAEKEESLQKYKGRLVLAGNAITRLMDNKQVFPEGADLGLFGEVTSLAGFRSVVWHSVRNGYQLGSADIANAYLNTKWPDSAAEHWLRIDRSTYEAMSPQLRAKIDAAGGIDVAFVKMDRCLYGHPVSGHAWIEELIEWLKGQGWSTLQGTPAVLTRGKSRLAVYVDDLIHAGPSVEASQFWSEVKAKYDISFQGECSEFLGVKVSVGKNSKGRFAKFSMTEYIDKIVQEFPGVVRKADTPMSDELRDAHKRQVTTPPVHVLKVIGKLLWVARCCRPDISFAVSRLASLAARWGDDCETQMRRVVGYLSKTSNDGLLYRYGGGTLITRIYADASWAAPRSQSGAILVEESEDGASLAALDWTSVKQSITADSSGASEIIAAHTAIRVHIAQACAFGVSSLVEVYTDNSTVVRIAEKGTSQQLAWLQMKPIAVRMGLLQDFVNLGIAKVKPVRTDRQKGDGFTKALDRVKLVQWRRLIGLGKMCSELDVSPPLQSQIQPKTPQGKVVGDTGETKTLAKVMAMMEATMAVAKGRQCSRGGVQKVRGGAPSTWAGTPPAFPL
jgi:hypothetical protein